PLRERATSDDRQTPTGEGWPTPHPTEGAAPSAPPSPARGEGANSTTACSAELTAFVLAHRACLKRHQRRHLEFAQLGGFRALAGALRAVALDRDALHQPALRIIVVHRRVLGRAVVPEHHHVRFPAVAILMLEHVRHAE